jgi:uncharacterized membrane protein YfcA
MYFPDMLMLFFAGIAGAAVNAVAGGGTLITFPAFLETGVSAVLANTSNAIAIWPGRLLSIASYRRELRRQRDRAIWTGAVCLLGGLAGALLLLNSGDRTFLLAVPWLILAATILFVFDAPMTRRFGVKVGTARPSPLAMVLLSVPLFLASVYGSYFGGGIGVIMMPILALTGVKDMQELNGLKNLLVTAIAGIGVVSYLIAGAVSWPGTLTMMAGAMIGGYVGGRLARRVSAPLLKKVVIIFGFIIAAYYFYKIYA